MLHLQCAKCARLTRHAIESHHSGERLPRCENCGTWKPTPVRKFRPARRRALKNPSPLFAIGTRATWTSKRNYSRPGEVVTVQKHQGDKYMILSAPDNARERKASPEGFSYWVDASELSPLQNPAPRSIAAARRLGEAFTGHPYNRALRIRQKPATGPRVAIGPVTGIMYLAKRDGKVEQYLHRFAPRSRPLLATLSDGTRLELLGGAFRFTDRGIVDSKVSTRTIRKRNRRT